MGKMSASSIALCGLSGLIGMTPTLTLAIILELGRRVSTDAGVPKISQGSHT
jgi:hypothetical protein